ncbi:MAG: hypothetical protein M1829_005451 [Trizodia sp. TS-e1964]|nr:MAG: hypothetical protein M1829_005451 [Trizodia sp. TS-e1964]
MLLSYTLCVAITFLPALTLSTPVVGHLISEIASNAATLQGHLLTKRGTIFPVDRDAILESQLDWPTTNSQKSLYYISEARRQILAAIDSNKDDIHGPSPPPLLVLSIGKNKPSLPNNVGYLLLPIPISDSLPDDKLLLASRVWWVTATQSVGMRYSRDATNVLTLAQFVAMCTVPMRPLGWIWDISNFVAAAAAESSISGMPGGTHRSRADWYITTFQNLRLDGIWQEPGL